MSNETPALIGVDWGTSNLRAFRFGAAGEVLDCRTSDAGIGRLAQGGFEAALAMLIDDWMSQRPPLWMCGMIGSRQGWVEAPYAACPADTHSLALATVSVPTRWGEARIVPGLTTLNAQGLHDVMRGEETQVFGCGAALSGAVVTPGTHSKWVQVDQGRVLDFRTAMTGEVFALMRDRSILGRLADGDDDDPDTFETGVRRALADPDLLALMFSARTEALFETIPATGVAAYLSGLLIGAEVAAAWPRAGRPATVAIIANPVLSDRYRIALTLAGVEDVRAVDGQAAVAAGLWQLFSTCLEGQKT